MENQNQIQKLQLKNGLLNDKIRQQSEELERQKIKE